MTDDPMYHDGMRRLQDARETRSLADRLQQVTVREAFTDDDRAFIQRCPMFFIATADARGRPDCSYKGGLPGFVRVLDDRTLAIPDYDGNGMYRTWGNVLVNPHVALMFLDFEQPKRLRVNGKAQVREDDPLRGEYPGSVFIIRVTANRIFPNCPRYIHRMQLVEHSVYVPRVEYEPPVPAWKTFDAFRDALPARDRAVVIDVRRDDLTSPEVQSLIAEHLSGMQSNSPPGHVHALAIGNLRAPGVTFWSAWADGILCGCGALKELDRLTGEVKSMRTREAFLRRGVGQAILDEIVRTGRERGYSRLLLETGTGPAFEPAHALYRRNGFEWSGPFGEYTATDFNVFMAKDLVQAASGQARTPGHPGQVPR